MDKEEQLTALADEIMRRHLQPEDTYEIAALLESMGWNDARAAEMYGVDDVFELAGLIWDNIQSRIDFTPFAEVKKLTLWEIAVMTIRQFLRGVIFAMPMAVSVASMLTFKFSLWSYENLTVDLATSIAIGTIVSFITVGGFTQAIARRGFFYIVQGYYNMGRKVTFYFIRIGFIVAVLMVFVILLLNLIFSVFPYYMLITIVLYFFFLNSIWLSVTVMYILRKELIFTGLIILGIMIVWLITLFTGFDNIIIAQLISLGIVSMIGTIIVMWYFKQAEAKMDKGISPQMPRMSITLYSTLPYFTYGFLYFAFLFIDRVIAWSTNDINMPYLIWFRGDYELGLDFSILLLIIPMGLSEVIVTKLMMDLETSQKAFRADETHLMNRMFVRLYSKRLIALAVVSACSAVLIYVLAKWLFVTQNPTSIGHVLFDVGDGSATHFIFLWSLASYAILAVGLMNAVVLFSLSQPSFVIRSIWPAFLINIVAGFLLSRWFGYEFAIFGLFLGSVFFAVVTTRYAIKALHKTDYYLYASS